MAIRVALQHRTTYRFDRLVTLSPHEIRLRPAPHCRTPILGYSFNVAPDKHFLNWQQDPYGNWLARLVFTEPADHLDIVIDLTADMTVINPFDFFVEAYAEHFPFTYAPALAKELIPFLETATLGPRLGAWLDRFRATREGRREDRRHAGPAQPAAARRNRLSGAHGARRPVARGDAGDGARLVSRLRLAAGADPAPARTRGAVRLGLPDPARRRREAARRPRRPGQGLHRSARLGRGLPARRRLGRLRPDVRAACRRGPYSARLHGGPRQRGAGDRLHRRLRNRIRRRNAPDPRARGPAGHQAVQRRAVGGDQGARPQRRSRSRAPRRASHAGRRAHVRLDRRHGRTGVELHGIVAEEAGARRGAAAPAREPLRARRPAARRSGQVVSRRTAAALGARRLLARRRQAAVARPGADRGYARARQCRYGGGATVCDNARDQPRRRCRVRAHRLRGRAIAADHGVGAAGQCRPVARGPAPGRRARSPRATPAARVGAAGGVRPAAAGRERRRRPRDRVAHQPVAAAARASLRVARRIAARIAPATGFVARRPPRRRRSRARDRPFRRARRVGGSGAFRERSGGGSRGRGRQARGCCRQSARGTGLPRIECPAGGDAVARNPSPPRRCRRRRHCRRRRPPTCRPC